MRIAPSRKPTVKECGELFVDLHHGQEPGEAGAEAPEKSANRGHKPSLTDRDRTRPEDTENW